MAWLAPRGAPLVFSPPSVLTLFFHFALPFGATTSRYLCQTWLPPQAPRARLRQSQGGKSTALESLDKSRETLDLGLPVPRSSYLPFVYVTIGNPAHVPALCRVLYESFDAHHLGVIGLPLLSYSLFYFSPVHFYRLHSTMPESPCWIAESF